MPLLNVAVTINEKESAVNEQNPMVCGVFVRFFRQFPFKDAKQ